jgi:hypothetical protein
MSAVLIALAVQIIVAVVLVVWTRSQVRSALGSGDEIAKVRREIGALIIELDASADRNITIVEDRLKSLKDLIVDADSRIALLSQERAKRSTEGIVYDKLGRASESRQKALETGRVQPTLQAIPPEVAGVQIQPGSEQAIPFIRFSEKPLPIEEPFADAVRTLSLRGFSSDVIAARLGTTIAEVDLVISLDAERGGQIGER